MRNLVPAELAERIGRLPQPALDDLRALADAWYKSEQDKLTTVADGAQLRQAQGAAQAFRDISKVLEQPEAFRTVSGSARRSSQFP